MTTPFTLWITGLPASGKSTITSALRTLLRKRDIDPAVLESDVFRKHFCPHATYSEEDRTLFYQGMVEVARIFIEHSVPVIIDATANRRAYRAPARERFPAFAEVYVECPLEICMARDPKGLYRQARAGTATTVPGVQAEYEPPFHPEVHVHADRENPDEAARKILDFLLQNEWIPSRRLYRV